MSKMFAPLAGKMVNFPAYSREPGIWPGIGRPDVAVLRSGHGTGHATGGGAEHGHCHLADRGAGHAHNEDPRPAQQ